MRLMCIYHVSVCVPVLCAQSQSLRWTVDLGWVVCLLLFRSCYCKSKLCIRTADWECSSPNSLILTFLPSRIFVVYIYSPCCLLAQDTEVPTGVPPDYRAAPFSCLSVPSLSVLFWPCNSMVFFFLSAVILVRRKPLINRLCTTCSAPNSRQTVSDELVYRVEHYSS